MTETYDILNEAGMESAGKYAGKGPARMATPGIVEKRIAYYPLIGTLGSGDAYYTAAEVIEDMAGYKETVPAYRSEAEADEEAKRRNAAIGRTEKDAYLVVASSMRAGRPAQVIHRLMVEGGEPTDTLFASQEAGARYIERHGVVGHYLELVEPCSNGIIHTAADESERMCYECEGILDCCCHEDG